MRINADRKHAGICFVGFVAAVVAFSAEAAAQVVQNPGLSAHRRTPSDFLPNSTVGFEHGRTSVSVAEKAYASQLRRHIAAFPLNRQKRDAYVGMRLLRKLYEGQKEKPKTQFNLLTELKLNPNDYVGRPVVLYGRIKRVRQTPGGATTVQLLDINSKTDSVLANIDVVSAGTQTPVLSENGHPARLIAYLIKLTDGNIPLMLSPRVEWLHRDTVDLKNIVAHKTRGVREAETDAYYETLMKTRLITYSAQQTWAKNALLNRIDERLLLAQKRHATERTKADSLQATDAGKASQLTQLADARLANEQELHKKYKASPEDYPLFADMFMNPSTYAGKPVTLTGHVRKVMSYDSDFERFGAFGGGKLHELWLYTSDSQQNPAVIICEKLPPDLPSSGNSVEGVTVTGYFFKLYRYAAGDADRAAPMILAKHVTWAPPAEQHIAGFGSAKSIATVLAILVGGCLMLYLWSNYQGDRRAREALSMVRSVEAKPEPPAPQLPTSQPTPAVTPRANPLARTVAEPELPSAPTQSPTPEPRAATFESLLTRTPAPAAQSVIPQPSPVEPEADPLARARQELEQSMQKLETKATTRRERLANAAASIAQASTPQPPEPTTPVTPTRPQPTASQVQPANIIGADIIRVLQQHDGGSYLELSTGVTLSLANDVVSLSQQAPATAKSSPEFRPLEGTRVSHLALDQWDRVYLLVDGTVFVTEDFEDDGRRCLIFGELTTLVAEEPDLALIDYWTRNPLS